MYLLLVICTCRPLASLARCYPRRLAAACWMSRVNWTVKSLVIATTF